MKQPANLTELLCDHNMKLYLIKFNSTKLNKIVNMYVKNEKKKWNKTLLEK